MKVVSSTFFTWLLVSFATAASAANITVGESFPRITIAELGECVVDGKEADFSPWQSDSLLGGVQVVEYVAARAGVDAIHKAFYESLAAAGITSEKIGIVKLVNSDDAMWGTSGLVAGEIKKNKQQQPDYVFVVDANGLGQKQWQLQKKTAAIAIVDPLGKVLFFKEGGLSAAEVDDAVALIKGIVE